MNNWLAVVFYVGFLYVLHTYIQAGCIDGEIYTHEVKKCVKPVELRDDISYICMDVRDGECVEVREPFEWESTDA